MDEILWEIPADRPRVIGAVAVENCTFTGCHFMNVGIAGQRDLIARFRD
jgi:hypothetical protein